jgi:hypothetical protein
MKTKDVKTFEHLRESVGNIIFFLHPNLGLTTKIRAWKGAG